MRFFLELNERVCNLELLLKLSLREHFTGAAKEGIGRHLERGRKPKRCEELEAAVGAFQAGLAGRIEQRIASIEAAMATMDERERKLAA